jgi:hypothetical protein
MPAVKIRKSAAAAAAPTLVVEFDEMVPRKRAVRFNPKGGKDGAAILALYVERAGWEAIGKPEAVRLTLEPLR